jgi:hypothetical protein
MTMLTDRYGSTRLVERDELDCRTPVRGGSVRTRRIWLGLVSGKPVSDRWSALWALSTTPR